jgi:peroxiredoxin
MEGNLVSLTTPLCNIGWKAKDFNLLGVDGKYWTPAKAIGENGLVVMFICNHCPYVKAIFDRLILDLAELKKIGINAVAISSNDPTNYPEDSYVNMKKISELKMFDFPYLFDESQEVARAYNAICTPDFFGFNESLELQYRGRFDSTGRGEPTEVNERDLFNAMTLVSKTRSGPTKQFHSVGCSIKWKEINQI